MEGRREEEGSAENGRGKGEGKRGEREGEGRRGKEREGEGRRGKEREGRERRKERIWKGVEKRRENFDQHFPHPSEHPSFSPHSRMPLASL